MMNELFIGGNVKRCIQCNRTVRDVQSSVKCPDDQQMEARSLYDPIPFERFLFFCLSCFFRGTPSQIAIYIFTAQT